MSGAASAAPRVVATEPKQHAEIRFRLFSEEDLHDLPEPVWQIEGLWEAGSHVVLFGASASGKSFLSLSWSLCVATGVLWQGRQVEAQGPVIYIYTEGIRNLKRRIAAWRSRNGIPARYSIPIHFLPEAVNFAEAKSTEVEELIRDIEAQLGGQRPALIVVDTLARNFGGEDESQSAPMSRFIRRCDMLRHHFGATVLVVHHTGHDRSRERGSSALRAAADSMMSLEKRGDAAVRVLKMEKQKDGEQDGEIHLCLVEVPEAGSCVLELADAQSIGGMKRKLTGKKAAALQALAECTDGRATYGEWQSKGGLNASSLGRWIKEFLGDGLIEQDPNVKVYFLSEKGKEVIGGT